MDIKEDNKNVQILKEELWTKRTIAEIMMLKRNKTIENSDLLEEIKRNNMKDIVATTRYKVQQ